MKALLPVYCRPLGYVVLLVALFTPFILVMRGVVTDHNLLFYKAVSYTHLTRPTNREV